ncbi:hypothetical protein BDZ89DRAFT_1073733, partial [Hymenopellis radicata]
VDYFMRDSTDFAAPTALASTLQALSSTPPLVQHTNSRRISEFPKLRPAPPLCTALKVPQCTVGRRQFCRMMTLWVQVSSSRWPRHP